MFQTKDGWMTVAAGSDERWARLVRIIDREELIDDPRFAKTPERMTNLDTVREILSPYFLGKSRAEWMALLENAGVPAGPILDTGEVFADEQTRHRNMVVEVEHSSVGKLETLGPAVKLSKSPTSVRRAAPRLGEHSAEVLAEFGYSESEIGDLLQAGVIELPAPLQSAAE